MPATVCNRYGMFSQAVPPSPTDIILVDVDVETPTIRISKRPSNDSCESTTKKLRTLLTDFDQDHETLIRENTRLRAKITVLEKQVPPFQTAHSPPSTNVIDLSESVTFEDDHNQPSITLPQHDRRVELETKDLRQQLQAQRYRNAKLITQAKATKSESQQHINTLLGDTARLERTVKTLQSRVSDLEADKDDLLGQIHDLQEEVEHLESFESRCESLEEEKAALEKEVEMKMVDVEEMRRESEAKDRLVVRVLGERDMWEKIAKRLGAKVDRLGDAVKELRNGVEEKCRSIGRMLDEE